MIVSVRHSNMYKSRAATTLVGQSTKMGYRWDGDRRRHKSIRLEATQSLQFQCPLRQQREHERDERGTINVDRFTQLCEEYNRFLHLTGQVNQDDPLDHGDISPDVIRYGEAFEQNVRTVEQLVDEVQLKLQQRCDDLEHQLDDFIIALAKTQHDAPGRNSLLSMTAGTELVISRDANVAIQISKWKSCKISCGTARLRMVLPSRNI